MNTPKAKRANYKRSLTALCLGAALMGGSWVQAAQYDAELNQVQQNWAQAVYKLSDKQSKQAALQRLTQTTGTLTQRYPNTAALLIWDGIVNSTLAGVQGGLGALGLAKKSRDQLERAKQLEPSALSGSAYTSLGVLYAKVPSWPLGFGNDKKALAHFQQALRINPQGLDPNYLYAEYLAEQGNTAGAVKHLQIAMRAPARPGRPLADAGRKMEVRQLLDKLQPQ